jgi:dienelactone hydrolase
MNDFFKPLLAVLLAWTLATPVLAQTAGPQDSERKEWREQVWRIPSAGGSRLMLSTVMRPPGEARHRLVVINHGSPALASQRPVMGRQRYIALSSWFVARDYVVVLPLRRGYGETSGRWAEGYGACEHPDYIDAGLHGAADIKAAIDYMHAQPFVDPDHTLVVGHSAGGWATIALSSLNPRGVSGMINFAGGRGGHQPLENGRLGNCVPDALVTAAGKYGATAHVPMLWIYAQNDSFFAPELAHRMAEAYDGAGGKATYRAVGAFGEDGHMLAESSGGVAIWQPLVFDFLRGLE